MEKLTLKVEGMACGHCEITVADAARKLPGVKKAKASKRKKQAVVEYDPEQVAPKQIADAINATGYRVVDEPRG